MWDKRDIILFLAGAEAFHTLTHIVLALSDSLPIRFFSLSWTKQLNMIGIVINALITALLIWWVSIL